MVAFDNGLEVMTLTLHSPKKPQFILENEFAINPNFPIPIVLKPNVVNLWYFKLRLFDPTEYIIWNIKGLRYRVTKIKGWEKIVTKT